MGSKSDQFANGARLYYECALAADEKIGILPGFEAIAPYPVMTLVAHSIELSLKSFLLANGCDNVRKFKHDLVSAYRECRSIADKKGIEIPEIDEEILAILSDIHCNMTLRYNESSRLNRLPVFGPLQILTESFLELCSAPELSELL